VQRVAILGSGGAGKTTVALELSRRTGLSVIHLDPLNWAPGWKPRPLEEFEAALVDAVAQEQWILDGNFLSGDAADPRFERVDAVIFLDLPRSTCIRRALARRMKSGGEHRPDLPDGCREEVELSFLRWMWGYPKRVRPRVLAILAGLGPEVAVHHLRSDDDVRRFLESV
jgi:adenylate kinase family enzyme